RTIGRTIGSRNAAPARSSANDNKTISARAWATRCSARGRWRRRLGRAGGGAQVRQQRGRLGWAGAVDDVDVQFAALDDDRGAVGARDRRSGQVGGFAPVASPGATRDRQRRKAPPQRP